MSWIETWLDTATAPPLATILAALDQSGARGINFYLGGRFSGGSGWTPELSAELARRRPDVGQFGTWVSLSPGQGGYALGHQDGIDCVAAARAYPAIAWLDYDVEPKTWQANPQGVDDAMRGFVDAVHAAGYHTMDYGTPDTVAGASNEDVIWIANPNPGGGDPAVQPLDPAYYAGKRAVQEGSAVFAGVTWDVTHSEFSVVESPPTPPLQQEDDDMADVVWLSVDANAAHGSLQYWFWRRHEADGTDSLVVDYYDGSVHQATVLKAGLRFGTGISAKYASGMDQVHVTGELADGTPFDRYTAPGGPWFDVVGLGGGDDAQPAPLVDVNALAAALAPHLQAVDEAKLAADLEAALPGPTAAAVQVAFGKALATG